MINYRIGWLQAFFFAGQAMLVPTEEWKITKDEGEMEGCSLLYTVQGQEYSLLWSSAKKKLGCTPCHTSQPSTNVPGPLKARNNMQCEWNLSLAAPEHWCQPTLVVWRESQVEQVPWQEMPCITCRHVDLQCCYSIQVQPQCVACKKLVNPRPHSTWMHFPWEEVAFPLKSSTPQGPYEISGKSDLIRICSRMPWQTLIILTMESNLGKFNLCSFKATFVSTKLLLLLSFESYAVPGRHIAYCGWGAADPSWEKLVYQCTACPFASCFILLAYPGIG